VLRDGQSPAKGLLQPILQATVSGVRPYQLNGTKQMLQA
jgi:hypothetical protein